MATASRSKKSAVATPAPWGARLATFALWALAGGSVVYWGLRLFDKPLPGAALAPAPAASTPDALALGRLLGMVPAPPPGAQAAAPVQGRMALVGLLAGRESGGGAALISIDGLPAKPFRVGATVEAGLVLQNVTGREAHLGPAPGAASTVTLAIPLPPGGVQPQ